MKETDVVIYASGKPWAEASEAAFAEGLDAHGIRAEIRPAGDRRVSDLAVVWSHRDLDLFRMQHAAGRRYLVMERGYLGDIEMRRAWTSLGLDGLNGRAVFPEPDPADDGARWERHFGHLMKPWRTAGRGDYALIMGQVPGDSALAGHDIGAWYAEAAESLAADWYCPVRFRPHPMAAERGHPPPDVPGADVLDDRGLDAALAGARVVATFNSNSAVDAVLAGTPALSFDEGSMAWDVTGHHWDVCYRPDRTDWAHALAWRQWTRDEIASGAAWARIAPLLDRNSGVES